MAVWVAKAAAETDQNTIEGFGRVSEIAMVVAQSRTVFVEISFVSCYVLLGSRSIGRVVSNGRVVEKFVRSSFHRRVLQQKGRELCGEEKRIIRDSSVVGTHVYASVGAAGVVVDVFILHTDTAESTTADATVGRGESPPRTRVEGKERKRPAVRLCTAILALLWDSRI